MTNSRAKGLTLIYHHVSIGTEATLTPDIPDIDLTKYRLLLVIAGKTTAALELQLILNAQTGASEYRQDGHSSIGGTLTAIDLSRADIQLMSADIATGAVTFFTETEIYNAGGEIAFRNLASCGNIGMEHTTGKSDTDSTIISSIVIETSTSTLAVPTSYSIYRIPI